ncbi:sugar transferase [Vannielia litorea]|uniref:sugar transferase n=1 Tax=Vannielia litorea TaxID=1217970 RepID=UPI001C986FBF|nr:sugar transferase [Vannielia litorea]MBY6049530.1 sugar transferase [Vannielia litorea]MBY6076944.1 sugar transferase [Vannielia litorea]
MKHHIKQESCAAEAVVFDGNMLLAKAPGIYRIVLKRIFDVAVVLFLAPTALAIILICAAIIAMDGHNPFYSQMRIGRGGRRFRMWKLRSMKVNSGALFRKHLAENPKAKREWTLNQKLTNDPRITKIGALIRKCSIDELPQLFNVLTGSMSLVGPRPMMEDQRSLYHGRGYFKLRPGLTGYWQISDRHTSEFTDRVFYDEKYNRELSFLVDMRILVKTIGVVFRCTGV